MRSEIRNGVLVYNQPSAVQPDDGKQRVREESPGYFVFTCPGCESRHCYRVGHGEPNWTFNGSLSRPTFYPSMIVRGDGVCHFFVTDGEIAFESDSTHALSGKKVELPEVGK
jgi:hypothetical protein